LSLTYTVSADFEDSNGSCSPQALSEDTVVTFDIETLSDITFEDQNNLPTDSLISFTLLNNPCYTELEVYRVSVLEEFPDAVIKPGFTVLDSTGDIVAQDLAVNVEDALEFTLQDPGNHTFIVNYSVVKSNLDVGPPLYITTANPGISFTAFQNPIYVEPTLNITKVILSTGNPANYEKQIEFINGQTIYLPTENNVEILDLVFTVNGNEYELSKTPQLEVLDDLYFTTNAVLSFGGMPVGFPTLISNTEGTYSFELALNSKIFGETITTQKSFNLVYFNVPEVEITAGLNQDLSDIDSSGQVCFTVAQKNGASVMPANIGDTTTFTPYISSDPSKFDSIDYDDLAGVGTESCLNLEDQANQFGPYFTFSPIFYFDFGRDDILFDSNAPFKVKPEQQIVTLDSQITYESVDIVETQVTGIDKFNLKSTSDDNQWTLAKTNSAANSSAISFSFYNGTSFQECTGNQYGLYACLDNISATDYSEFTAVNAAGSDFYTGVADYNNSFVLFRQDGDGMQVVQFSVMPTYIFLVDDAQEVVLDSINRNATNNVVFRDPLQNLNNSPNQTIDLTISPINQIVTLTEVEDSGIFLGEFTIANSVTATTLELQVNTTTNSVSTPVLAKYNNPNFYSNFEYADADPVAQIYTNKLEPIPSQEVIQYLSDTTLSANEEPVNYRFTYNNKFFCSEKINAGTNNGLSFLVYLEDPNEVIVPQLFDPGDLGGGGAVGGFGGFDGPIQLQSFEDNEQFTCMNLVLDISDQSVISDGLSVQVIKDQTNELNTTYKNSVAKEDLQTGWNRITLSNQSYTQLVGNGPGAMEQQATLNPNQVEFLQIALRANVEENDFFDFRLADVNFNYLSTPRTLQSGFALAAAPTQSNPTTGSTGSNPTTNPPVDPSKLQANFAALNGTILNLYNKDRVCTLITNLSTGNYTTSSWKVYKGDSLMASSDRKNTTLCFISTGTYTVELTVSDSKTADNLKRTNYLTVINQLETPVQPPSENPIPAPVPTPTPAPTSGPANPPTNGPTSTPTQSPTENPTETTSSFDSIFDSAEIETDFRGAALPAEERFNECLADTSQYPNINPNLDTDKDGLPDVIELSFGTNPNVANPQDINAFLSGKCQQDNLNDLIVEDDYMQLNFKVENPTLASLMIPGSVFSSDNFTQVCFAISGKLNFELGCTDLEKVGKSDQSNFSYFSEKKLPAGQYTVTATATTPNGKKVVARHDFEKVAKTFPVNLVDFAGLDPSNFETRLSDPSDPNSAVIITVPKDADLEQLYATFFAGDLLPDQYVIEAYWNSLVLSSAALSDTTTGYTTVNAPQWFKLTSETSHKLIVNAYSLKNPGVLSQTLIIEFTGKNNNLLWILLAALIVTLTIATTVYARRKNKILQSLDSPINLQLESLTATETSNIA
jgi:PKD repeat protein